MTELVREPALYLGGEWVPGRGGDCEVENPATEETTGIAAQASRGDVDQAVTAAREAAGGWAATPVPDRVAALRRLHEVIAGRADHFAGLINREQGSPPPVARKLHVDTPLSVIAEAAGALAEFPFSERRGNSVILREPAGVVAAITPWNLPLHQIVVKVVPALAAGCTVVLKPAGRSATTASGTSWRSRRCSCERRLPGRGRRRRAAVHRPADGRGADPAAGT